MAVRIHPGGPVKTYACTECGAVGSAPTHRPECSQFSDSIFARRLREVRTAAGITQQQLAGQMAETGHRMYHSTIAKIEAEDRLVTIGEAVRFAAILGVPLAELISEEAPGV